MNSARLEKGRNCADVLILIDQTAAQNMEEREAQERYRKDAEALFFYLYNSLPGGTYDALRVILQRQWRKSARELCESWSCSACGWKGTTPLFLPSFVTLCPECEAEATPHRL